MTAAQHHDYYRVLRAFEGDRPFVAGEIVDGTGWRWARQLVERRFLAPCPAPAVDAPATPEDAARPVRTTRRD